MLQHRCEDVNYSGSTAADDKNAEYKAWTVGLGYTGLTNLAIVGEYGKNQVTMQKSWTRVLPLDRLIGKKALGMLQLQKGSTSD